MERRSSALRTPANPQRRSSRSRTSVYPSCIGNPSQLRQLRRTTNRSLKKSRDVSERVTPEQVAHLVKVEWHLSYATPLYQFRHTQLKPYSQQLAAFIVSERQQGLAVEVGHASNLKVTFSVVDGLAETEDDAATVFIQIHSRKPFAAQDDPQKAVWSGWLACVGGDPAYLQSLPEDFVSLPLFCSSGPETLTALVKAWFQRTFDCCFGPLPINEVNLQWLAAMWTSCHEDSNIRQLTLVWVMPSQPNMNIRYTVQGSDAWALWSSTRQDQGEDGALDLQDVTSFMRSLEVHFHRHFRIDLAAGRLMHVSTALGTARQPGRIKITSSRYMNAVLMLLTECALLKMPIF